MKRIGMLYMTIVCLFQLNLAGLLAQGQEIPPPEEECLFVRGDADGNGRVELADATFVMRLLRGELLPRACQAAAADANDDEQVSDADVAAILAALFQDEPLPPPGPEPGVDPTEPPSFQRKGRTVADVADAADVADVEAQGPQVEREDEEEDRDREESYIRLGLRLSDAGLEVAEARVIAGPLVTSDVVTGEYVYEVRTAEGRCLGVGSLTDPRLLRGARVPDRGAEERSDGTRDPAAIVDSDEELGADAPRDSAEEDDHSEHEHSLERLAEGEFSVRFPNTGLTQEDLLGLRVRLHRRNEEGASLLRIDPTTIDRYRERGLELQFETEEGALDSVLLAELQRFATGGEIEFPGDDVITYGLDLYLPEVHPLLVNGSPGSKKNVVIIGDGFSYGDQEEFNALANDLVVKGALGHDVFKDALNAFNVYRINTYSHESGVTEGTHTQWESVEVSYPNSNNLPNGTVWLVLPGVGNFPISVSGSNRSLKSVQDGIKNISAWKVDPCGNNVEHKFKTRMKVTKFDGNGNPEKAKLWVGAPTGLPGAGGDFTIVVTGGTAYSLSFSKTKTGTLTPKNTSLGYSFSGEWDYCWLQSTCITPSRLSQAMALVADVDAVVVILNHPSYGGCGGWEFQGAKFQVIPKGVSWGVVAHEMGHGIGGLADEYTTPRTYTGPKPTQPNLDNTSSKNLIKWKDFIDPNTPTPTTCGDVSDSSFEAGAFEGGGTYSKGIYRPVCNCRMKSGSQFCPVCYKHIRDVLDPFLPQNLWKVYKGDFNGDGRQDLVQHYDRTLKLFLSDGSKLVPTFTTTERLPTGGWQIRSADRYYVGDFNGDGMDDLFVYNYHNWSMEYLGCLRSTGTGFVKSARYDDSIPGWTFSAGDRHFVGDFSGDGQDDLYVFNGTSWGPEYVGMYRSTGTGLQVVKVYSGWLPGWDMGNHDKLHVGDINGDGKDDLYVQNTTDWGSNKYVGLFRSNGTSLTKWLHYTNSLAGWIMAKNDRLHVADFNGDGRSDLYVSSGLDWNNEYLGMFRSNGSSLSFIKLYTNYLPNWNMGNHDAYYVADVNGDGKDDLYVMNKYDWNTKYVGWLRSTGTELTAAKYYAGSLGLYNFSSGDGLLPLDFSGDGRDDLIIHSFTRLGLFRKGFFFKSDYLSFRRKYEGWIYNFLYYAPWGHN